MKKKIHKIWGVGFVVVLAASLLLSAAPVSAGDLSWGSETIPDTSGNVILKDSDVVDLGVYGGGDTIYAAVGTTNLYKSTDRGKAFSSITTDNDTDLVAVAPDEPDIVAYADTTLKVVWISINGGSSWGSLGTPQEGSLDACTVINDLAISQDSGGTHYIGVAGKEATSGANVWFFDLGAAAPVWKETNSKPGFSTTSTTANLTVTTAAAVEFSPNFASDLVMAVVTGNASDGVDLQLFSLNTKSWNNAAAFGSDYPAQIVAATTLTDITKASIALAPDYLGSDDATRIGFFGLDIAGSTAATSSDLSGIYRMKDTSDKDLSTGVDIWSVDYDGTNLVAGRQDDNVVYRCDDPLASSPTVSSSSSLKSPSGETNLVVAWTGSDVVSGTTGTESSFSVSRDNGKTFNDLSLIDSGLTNLMDVAVSADGEVIYLATDNGTNLSLWRKASEWERVLMVTDTSPDYIVRISPDDPDVVYVAKQGSKTIYYSSNGGGEKWFTRASRYTIQDIAVEGDDVVYVGVDSAATVSKSTNSGFTWGSAESTSLAGGYIHTIVSLGEDKVLVGSTTGYVSYSTDGNDSWTKISEQIESGATNLQVTASGLSDGDFIYAASNSAGDDIRRWEIGESTSWSDIINGTLTFGATGIALSDAGVLYVLSANTTAGGDSYFHRALSPSTAGDATTWSTATSALENFAAAPSALRISSGSTKLWALDQTANAEDLFSYIDTIAEAGPTLTGPSDGADVSVNWISGATYTVSFTWDRPSKGTKYNLEIALDSAFDEKIINYTGTTVIESTSSTVAQAVSGDLLMPDTTYYWRVRTASDGPIYSPYSDVRSFLIGELPEALPPVIIQQPPAPVIQVPPAPSITITPPEIVLPPAPAPPPEIVIPPAPAPPAPITPAFIWAIIIIGAILVIAVVVLIVRTRRPV